MIDITQAIFQLYPSVITVVGGVAYDAQGNEVSYDSAAVQNQALIDQCKTTASALLFDTDWTTIADVANPVKSPYLANQADFIIYRNQVRKLAVTPVTDPVFPPKPDQVWK